MDNIDQLIKDLSTQHYIPLDEICKLLPPNKEGAHISKKTLIKWVKQGCYGIRLKAVPIGIRWCTTKEWLDEFFLAQANRKIHNNLKAFQDNKLRKAGLIE